MSAPKLVDGPRGRRVVVGAAAEFDPAIWRAWLEAGWSREVRGSGGDSALRRFVTYGDVPREQTLARLRDPERSLDELHDLLDGFARARFSGLADPLDLLTALDRTVSSAAYWEPADEQDRVLTDPRLQPVLEALSGALLESRATRWWQTRCDLSAQRWSDRWDEETGHRTGPPPLLGASDALSQWADRVQEEEVRARQERPEDPAAPWGGTWWSSPRTLLHTTRALPGLGSVDLALVEDGFGEPDAEVHPLAPIRPVRILEIDGPEAWVELVGAHPIDVTRSRLHVWYHATGCRGPWRIPDWRAVAEEWDAVHVSVLGYLRAATRALPVGGGFTMLAGWSPDETLWLTDALASSGPIERWTRPDERWERSP